MSRWRALSGVIWLPIVLVLAVLQPVVQTVCMTLMLLGLAVSVLFEVSGAAETFPFWKMAGISAGFGVFAVLYATLVNYLAVDCDHH